MFYSIYQRLVELNHVPGYGRGYILTGVTEVANNTTKVFDRIHHYVGKSSRI
jgi:hypothetical protein